MLLLRANQSENRTYRLWRLAERCDDYPFTVEWRLFFLLYYCVQLYWFGHHQANYYRWLGSSLQEESNKRGEQIVLGWYTISIVKHTYRDMNTINIRTTIIGQHTQQNSRSSKEPNDDALPSKLGKFRSEANLPVMRVPHTTLMNENIIYTLHHFYQCLSIKHAKTTTCIQMQRCGKRNIVILL